MYGIFVSAVVSLAAEEQTELGRADALAANKP